jgi:hypothetical protein
MLATIPDKLDEGVDEVELVSVSILKPSSVLEFDHNNRDGLKSELHQIDLLYSHTYISFIMYILQSSSCGCSRRETRPLLP